MMTSCGDGATWATRSGMPANCRGRGGGARRPGRAWRAPAELCPDPLRPLHGWAQRRPRRRAHPGCGPPSRARRARSGRRAPRDMALARRAHPAPAAPGDAPIRVRRLRAPAAPRPLAGRGRTAAEARAVVGAMSDAAVDGIVLAAGRGERLGLGPKAWLTLGGRTLLERAVATMRLVADRVTVGVAVGDVERARAVCGADAVVVAGGATHRETMVAAFRAGSAPWVLVHDVAHPFLTPDLARGVIDAARAGQRRRRCRPRSRVRLSHAARRRARTARTGHRLAGAQAVRLQARRLRARPRHGRRRRRPERAPRARGRAHATGPRVALAHQGDDGRGLVAGPGDRATTTPCVKPGGARSPLRGGPSSSCSRPSAAWRRSCRPPSCPAGFTGNA